MSDRSITGHRRRAIALCLVLALHGSSFAMSPEVQQQWNETAGSYLAGDAGSRDRLLALARQDVPDDLPPLLRLVLGDAYLRAGRSRQAGEQFDSVLNGDAGDPWMGMAAIGRGWVATERGDLTAARELFEAGARDPGTNGLVATYMVAMIDATRGDTAAAIAAFDALANNPAAPDTLQTAAAMGGGYARLWSGDDAGARDAFASVATSARDGRLADDAAYLTGLATWRTGDPDGAAEILGALKDGTPDPKHRASASGGGLDPRRLVRSGFKRYRQSSVRAPIDLVVPMLDLDGPALARRALHLMATGAPPPAPSPLAGRTSARGQDVDFLAPAEHAPTPSAPRGATPASSSMTAFARVRQSYLAWVLVATAVASLLAWRMRARAR